MSTAPSPAVDPPGDVLKALGPGGIFGAVNEKVPSMGYGGGTQEVAGAQLRHTLSSGHHDVQASDQDLACEKLTSSASAAFGSAVDNATLVGNGGGMGMLIGVHTGPAMAEEPTSTTEMRFCNRKCKEKRPISEFRKPWHKGCRDCLDYDKGCRERGKAKRLANIPVAIHPRTPGQPLEAQIADAILAIGNREPIMLRELAAQQTGEAETVAFEGSLPHQLLYEAFPDRPIGYYFDIWKYLVLSYLGHR